MSGYLRIDKKPLPKIALLLIVFILLPGITELSGFFYRSPVVKFHGSVIEGSPNSYLEAAKNILRDFKLSDRSNIYIMLTKEEFPQGRVAHYLANAPFNLFPGLIFANLYFLHLFLSKNQTNFAKFTVNFAILVLILMFLYFFIYLQFIVKNTYSEILSKYPYLKFEPDYYKIVGNFYLTILGVVVFYFYRKAIYEQPTSDAQVIELKF
jgi:hypothetical protein